MNIPILTVKDAEGNIIEIPAIKGEKGDPAEITEGSIETKHLANYAVNRYKIALGALNEAHFGDTVMPIVVPDGDESVMRDLNFYTSNGVYFFNGFEKINTPEGLSYSLFYLFVSTDSQTASQLVLCGGEQPSLWGRVCDLFNAEWSEWQKLEGGGSFELADGSVQTTHLADGAVTSDKIANLAITKGKIANGAVEGGCIKVLAVSETRLANNAVSTRTIADGAVTAVKIADDAKQEIAEIVLGMLQNGDEVSY